MRKSELALIEPFYLIAVIGLFNPKIRQPVSLGQFAVKAQPIKNCPTVCICIQDLCGIHSALIQRKSELHIIGTRPADVLRRELKVNLHIPQIIVCVKQFPAYFKFRILRFRFAESVKARFSHLIFYIIISCIEKYTGYSQP